MKKQIQYLVPIFIGYIYLIDWIFSIYSSFQIYHESIFYLKQFLRLVNPLIFCIFYFLSKLVLKDKKHFIWVVLIYVFAFTYPFLRGYSDLIYNFYCLFTVFMYSFCGCICFLGYDWYQKNRKNKELEKQNLQSELALLKNQINPHFLFNTLNNIDSLIKTNPNHASQSLIELSDMMRYMLYETKPERVPLQNELAYIENYMKLQKLQYGNTELAAYSVTGNPDEIKVAPMLFIPFIENAFKHCTDKEKIHAIRFSFEISPKQIIFQSSNISDDKHLISKDSSTGIGLETVKRRLEILYPNRYSLQIDKKNDLFCISLSIDLDD
jgi:hypothetical protein